MPTKKGNRSIADEIVAGLQGFVYQFVSWPRWVCQQPNCCCQLLIIQNRPLPGQCPGCGAPTSSKG